jgi:hypothetical protein
MDAVPLAAAKWSASGKRATAPTSPRIRGGQDGTDADQVDQPGAAGRDQRGQLAGELTDLTVEFAEPHDAAAGESGPHRWLVGE